MTDRARPTTIREAQAVKAAIAEQMRRHDPVCRCCKVLTANRARYCKEGWELARAKARADSDLARLIEQNTIAPAALF